MIDEHPLAENLDRAIAEFQSDPRTPSLLRRVAREHPDLFFTVAAKHLESGVESPAHKFLALVIIRLESFFEHLANPARCSCASAVCLFRRLLAVNSSLDFKLARMLPGREDSDPANTRRGPSLTGPSMTRAMDILDQTSPGLRLMSVIRHLPNHADERVSTKGALFVGRRVNNPSWTARQLAQENPRLRANAVEASWGKKSEEALQILRDCTGDASPRVAGNGLIGLFMAGCPEVVDRALAMSESAEPRLRSTAAWAMGKIGNPVFVGRLTALLRDENPQVRSTAVRSLVEVGRNERKRAPAVVIEPALEPVDEPVAPIEPAPEPTFEIKLDGSSFRTAQR